MLWLLFTFTVGTSFLSNSTCLSIQRCLRVRISANNKGFDCDRSCIIFLELAIMFQVRDWGLVQGTKLLISGEWIFIRGWEAFGLIEKNGALKIVTFLLYRNYQCMKKIIFYSVPSGQNKIFATHFWVLVILRSQNILIFNLFLENMYFTYKIDPEISLLRVDEQMVQIHQFVQEVIVICLLFKQVILSKLVAFP